MDRRFELRKEALLKEAKVSPNVFRENLERLEKFTAPFAALLVRSEQREHAARFISGLLSDLDRKNTESIAYRHDQDRKDLQNFIGQSKWNHEPLLMELGTQVGDELGCPDGVLVFDPSAFPKKGTESVGVARQWCGRLGKVENCQVGVYMGYVSGEEHALVNARLYLPKEWATDWERRKKCQIPSHIRFKKRYELCMEMLKEMGHLLPHQWIAADEEFGRISAFRRKLRDLGERYLLTVPCDTSIRDLEAEIPASRGRNAKQPFQRVDHWCAALAEDAWTTIDVRDGEKGPLKMGIVKCRVQARMERSRVGPEELLVVIRRQNEKGEMIYDYCLSNASPETQLRELARVAKAEHRIEECIQRGKSETGLADYEVRSWPGWFHHQTLSLTAAWFLIKETRRGKKMDTGAHVPANARGDIATTAHCFSVRWSHADRTRTDTPTRAKSTSAPLSLQTC
jgi:SRSO17 transposase